VSICHGPSRLHIPPHPRRKTTGYTREGTSILRAVWENFRNAFPQTGLEEVGSDSSGCTVMIRSDPRGTRINGQTSNLIRNGLGAFTPAPPSPVMAVHLATGSQGIGHRRTQGRWRELRLRIDGLGAFLKTKNINRSVTYHLERLARYVLTIPHSPH